MKNAYIFISALVLISTSLCVNARQTPDVVINDFTVEIRDGHMNLDLELDLSGLDVKGTQVVVFTPCISKGNNSVMLKSVGIYGRNRRVWYQRNAALKPTGNADNELRPSATDDMFIYHDSVEFIPWMDGCRLTLLRKDYGCCNEADLISETELVGKFPLDPYIPELIYIRPEPETAKIREISGTAFIDFPVSRTEIYPEYRNNIAELSKITGTIDSVRNDSDITIKSISIKGYASPESPYSNNTYLAKGRTAALKDYVRNLYHFEDGFITTSYEPEDWDGLQEYVMASDLPHKDEILETIRSDRDPDVKEWIIKSRWKDDYKYLLQHCYPALRHSDYRIEYTIRSFSDTLEIEKVYRTSPQKLSLEELHVLSQYYEPGSENYNELFETAVRMYPDDPVANLNAANTAICNRDYDRAMRYLDNAGDAPEAAYARGVLEVYREDYEAARPYLEDAFSRGITQAAVTLEEISKNRMIYRMKDNQQ